MMAWNYFKDDAGNIWAKVPFGNYGLIGVGWFEDKFALMERPTVPKHF